MGSGIYPWPAVMARLKVTIGAGNAVGQVIRQLVIDGSPVTSPVVVRPSSEVQIAWGAWSRGFALIVGDYVLAVVPLTDAKFREQQAKGRPVDTRGVTASPSSWFTPIGADSLVVDVYNTEVLYIGRS